MIPDQLNKCKSPSGQDWAFTLTWANMVKAEA